MDDNELDRLFGEDGGSEDKASDESARSPEKESDKKARKKKPSDNAAKESLFVERKADNSKDKSKEKSEDKSEEKSKDTEDSDDKEEKSKPESEENMDKEKESGSDKEEDKESEAAEKSEDSENSEDTEEDEKSEEDEENEDAEEEPDEQEKEHSKKPAKSAPANRERVARKRPEPVQQKSLAEIIPLNTKSIVIICLAVALVIMVALVMFLPAFRVRNAHVEGNIVLSDQEVLKEVGLEYDAHLMSGVSGNIFDIIRLNYGKTEERIKKENPYIEDIRISIRLPSTVDITIKERSKVCYVRTPDGYAALDKDGIVLELSSFDSKRTVQPVICGLNITSAELGKRVKISNMNDYKKAIIVLGAILAADNASVGGDYCMFENTSEVRILPSGYIFLTIYSPSGNLIQIKLNSTDSIGDDMAWLLYAFNADAFDKVTVDGALDMTGDEYTFREY